MMMVKDSTSATAAPPIPTMLPTTCGEETDLPGVPRVGCVATVTFCPNTLQSFSAAFVATADSVAILGPDLDQRRSGRRCLFTRHLWRPAALVEAAANRHSGGGGGTAPGSTPLSFSLSSPLTAATTAGMLSHADGGGVNIIALTACSLSLSSTEFSSGEFNNQQQSMRESSASDAVAVVVAWADFGLQHHVTVLVLHLKRVLSPSWTGYVDGSLVRLVTQDALPLPPTQAVLRLFYHPTMTATPTPAESTEVKGVLRSSKHVIMCSLCAPWSSCSPRFGVGSQYSNTESGAAAALLKKGSASTISGGGGTADRSATSGSLGAAAAATSAASPRRRGQLCFLTVSLEKCGDDETVPCSNQGDEGNEKTEEKLHVTAQPSAFDDVASWLRDFRIDRVVCAFAVQSSTSTATTMRAIAAAGTTDGRVFVLGATSHRLVRRVSGPVADVIFVRTKPAKVDAASRNAVVDEILNDAIAEDVFKNGSFSSATDTEFARHDESDFTALVVLDSAGHLLVLHAVNSGAPITQTVPDLPQILTLASGQRRTLTFVSSSATNLDEDTHVSSKNFLDLSSLRHFIGRRHTTQAHQQQQSRSRQVASTTSPSNPPFASSSLTATPVNTSFTSGGSGDEPILSGHILSRGLICVTNFDWGKGRCELVVSTMGQVVVSVPFSPTEGCFRIAGFTVTPAPMFYVGFVDFFADGNPTLVMAGLKNVLVASRPQSTIRERAQLLLRLLKKKERERCHSNGDDDVDR